MMELPPITSSQNRQISQVRRLLARPRDCRRDGVLVAEGIHLVQEAIKAGLRCRALLVTVSERDPEVNALRDEAERLRLPVYRVLDHLFRAISAVETPQGIVGVFDRPQTERAELWGRGTPEPPSRHLCVAHGLQDPTNVGAITRSALAAGVGALITTEGTVDPFHHRALRAAMGASFQLPIVTGEPVGPLLRRLTNVGYRLVGLSPRGRHDLTELDPTIPSALVLGAEGSGLEPAVAGALTMEVRIPMEPAVESLGVAAAAAVTFFWLRLISRNGRGQR